MLMWVLADGHLLEHILQLCLWLGSSDESWAAGQHPFFKLGRKEDCARVVKRFDGKFWHKNGNA